MFKKLKKKKMIVFSLTLFLLAPISASAALREEWKDRDGDGKKETRTFRDGKKLVRTEIDSNGLLFSNIGIFNLFGF